MNDLSGLSTILKSRRVEVSEEVYEEKANEHRGYDTIERNEDGTLKEWAAKDAAFETPQPLMLKKGLV